MYFQRLFLILSVLSITQKIYAQDSIYFNKIYNPNNTYAKGRGIVQIDDYYYCLFGAKSTSDIEIMMGLCKLDLNGSLIDYSIIGEANHHYFPGNVGGTLIKTNDGNLAFSIHIQNINTAYATLLKLNLELDTIWKRNYYTENFWTLSFNCRQTSDNGYVLVGSVAPTEESYWDCLLLKTDSVGNMLWYQTYSYPLQEEGESVIQTPDGGYLLGGFRYDPAVYHSLNALVIKTDSLGNEEWTKTFGNPNVDDDMAHVALTDDGNYLMATVYGEWIIAPGARTGRIFLVKIDSDGNTIWSNKIGPKRMEIYMKNLSSTNDGNLIASSFFMDDTTSDYPYIGNLYKFTQEGDSIWMRDYYYYNNQYDWNMLYDVYPCSDKGHIGVGLARPDIGTEKLWIIKVDSMGCDTAGCATGTWISEFFFSGGGQVEDLLVYPNPAHDYVIFQLINSLLIPKITSCQILITGSFGKPINQIPVTGNKTIFDCHHLPAGIYFYQFQTNEKTYSGKFLKIN